MWAIPSPSKQVEAVHNSKVRASVSHLFCSKFRHNLFEKNGMGLFYVVACVFTRLPSRDLAFVVWLGVTTANFPRLTVGIEQRHDAWVPGDAPDFPIPNYSRLIPRTLRKQS